jgi:hypothetical protein
MFRHAASMCGSENVYTRQWYWAGWRPPDASGLRGAVTFCENVFCTPEPPCLRLHSRHDHVRWQPAHLPGSTGGAGVWVNPAGIVTCSWARLAVVGGRYSGVDVTVPSTRLVPCPKL